VDAQGRPCCISNGAGDLLTPSVVLFEEPGTVVEVTRDEFEEATAALLERTRLTAELVVRQAGLGWEQIDRAGLSPGGQRPGRGDSQAEPGLWHSAGEETVITAAVRAVTARFDRNCYPNMQTWKEEHPMSAKIILRVAKGPLVGERFVFSQRLVGMVGRSPECCLTLPGGDDNLTVSRRHCMIDIDPPHIRVRDLGSRNGTYVNGHNIGQRHEGANRDEPASTSPPDVDLQDGDTVRVGNTVFQVAIVDAEPDLIFGDLGIPAIEREARELAGSGVR
jgi:hypothetical protein